MTEFKDVLIENTNPEKSEPSIVDDFMYGSNVASSHVTIRMGYYGICIYLFKRKQTYEIESQ